MSTMFNALISGMVAEGKRAMWQLSEVRLYDGGPDRFGMSEDDNTLFMTQGVFVP